MRDIKSRTWSTKQHIGVVDTSLVAARELAHEFIACRESDDAEKRENQRQRAGNVPPTEDLGRSVIHLDEGQSNGRAYQTEIIGIPGEEHVHLATVADHCGSAHVVLCLHMMRVVHSY